MLQYRLVEKGCLTFACKVTEQHASGVLGGPSLRVILMRSVCDTVATVSRHCARAVWAKQSMCLVRRDENGSDTNGYH